MKTQSYIWGFMLENTFFMEFDESNHIVIETAYQQKKLQQTSHHILIRDSHLPCEAKIYFGVAQIHLRMPGTRYYVKRKTVGPRASNNTQQHSLRRCRRRHSQQSPSRSLIHQEPSSTLMQSYIPFSSSLMMDPSFMWIPPTPSYSTTMVPSPINTTEPLQSSSSSSTSSSSSSSHLDDLLASPDNYWNYSWLDSLQTSSPSSTKALLIPWSTNPSSL
ncbi:uncharacterized protein BX664DRAFT_314750 [Halteromyces radiatus]|uniref:uncharacterized protein n=1 Tax=Halteromyces radiatus TaxID=101107 RepID=UPI00221E7F7D|nr:uncharacterized protein BX664DRAFT_314750 [Halteromyces radiatus]KAI8089554.1 hypothetical protein BX664DRAFT_314750 [Halteromyces radiatus]